MISKNETNMQSELANKTDNRTLSYKHDTRRILVQKRNTTLCNNRNDLLHPSFALKIVSC